MRIELRQIGVRDETKILGGIGICGRILCCNSYLSEFAPVSIKMAKEQGLSLNPTKISGTCGRLMCCLKYEQDAYEELLHSTPRVGSTVRTKDGRGIVTEVNLLTGMLKVASEKDQAATKYYNKSEVKLVRGDRPAREGTRGDRPGYPRAGSKRSGLSAVVSSSAFRVRKSYWDR